MFKHNIHMYNFQDDKRDMVIASKKFPHLFIDSALDWFSQIVLGEYPEAEKISDRTLTGFHFELVDLVFELR